MARTTTTRTAAPLMALATLAALGLPAQPAAAQPLMLSNGDTVTTSGTAAFTLGAGGSVTAGDTMYPGSGGIALSASGSGPITITGGTLTGGGHGEALGTYNNPVTISGGTFSAGTYGTTLSAYNSSVTITGGVFSVGSGGHMLGEGGTSKMDLYGSFMDPSGLALTPGQTENLSSGSGTFSGTLENETAGQSFSFYNSGTITLHDVGPSVAAAPEPSEWAALGFTALGIGGLLLRARKRKADAACRHAGNLLDAMTVGDIRKGPGLYDRPFFFVRPPHAVWASRAGRTRDERSTARWERRRSPRSGIMGQSLD